MEVVCDVMIGGLWVCVHVDGCGYRSVVRIVMGEVLMECWRCGIGGGWWVNC